jgi:hypothetical protein
MLSYIGQAAQQALEALATGEPLDERLKAARARLSVVTSDDYLQSAPRHVQKCLSGIRDISDNESKAEIARKIREAIENIFEALGREHPEG